MTARRKKKSWYEKHLGTSKAGKVYWRLPKVQWWRCCECGCVIYDAPDDGTERPKSPPAHKPDNGNGVLCAECAGEKDAAAWGECVKEIRALAKRTGCFPSLESCDQAVRWINRWRIPGESKWRSLMDRSYRSNNPTQAQKVPTVPAKERAAGKVLKVKFKALYNVAARYDANNLFACFAPGHVKEKAVARKAMKAYFEIAGWKFTPLKAVEEKGAAG